MSITYYQLTKYFVVAGIITLRQKATVAANFASCLTSAAHFVAASGDCYELVYADAGIDYAQAIDLCRPGGHPAFLTGADVRTALRDMAINENQQAFVGLVQDDGQTDLRAGWNWQHPDGRKWSAYHELIGWISGEPDTLDQHNTLVFFNGGLFDIDGHLQLAVQVFCQFGARKRHIKGMMHGERPTYPIAETLTDVGTALKCAIACHNTSVCDGFGYSAASRDCILTQLAPNDPDTVTTPDQDFIFYAKLAFI